jgi:hypothetical protein
MMKPCKLSLFTQEFQEFGQRVVELGLFSVGLSVGWCEIRVGGDSHPSSGQLLLGSVDNAAAPGATFALGGLGLAGLVNLGDAVVAVGMAVAAKRPKIKILEQIWCSSSASKLISRKIFGEIFKVECRRCRKKIALYEIQR